MHSVISKSAYKASEQSRPRRDEGEEQRMYARL
jgi:hypothetical protein